jgi:hypothetical protein
VGSGFLVWGGSSNGGRRGAFWLGARRAFENTGILRLRKDGFRGDFFYLTPNDNPNTNTDVLGTNLEYDITDRTEIGFMYLNILNSDRVRRDGMSVFNFRGKTAPLASLPGLQLNGELALEENGSKVNSALGGYVGIGYEFAELPWKPRVSYRFAGFSGDRRGKGTDKAFDPLFYGQSDWGTWFQGEILGNWVVANQNLLSWLLRLELRPVESLTLNLLYFHFNLAELTTTEVSRDGVLHTVNVNSKNLGDEVNFAADWEVNKHSAVYRSLRLQRTRQSSAAIHRWQQSMVQFHAVYGSEVLKHVRDGDNKPIERGRRQWLSQMPIVIPGSCSCFTCEPKTAE